MIKIHGYAWFSNASTIGIVISENTMKEKQAHISKVSGFDEKMDIKWICEHGAKFPLEAAEMVVSSHGSNHIKEV